MQAIGQIRKADSIFIKNMSRHQIVCQKLEQLASCQRTRLKAPDQAAGPLKELAVKDCMFCRAGETCRTQERLFIRKMHCDVVDQGVNQGGDIGI